MSVTTRKITAAEFAQLPESQSITELHKGEVIVAPAPSEQHQDVVLSTAIFLRQNVRDGKVKIAPTDVYLDAHNVVQPDVFWAGGASSACQLDEHLKWQGPPDLVVEVISPASDKRDRGTKFDLYQQHGVREYWLIEPIRQYLEVHVHAGESFERVGVFDVDARFTSQVLGRDVPVSALFRGE